MLLGLPGSYTRAVPSYLVLVQQRKFRCCFCNILFSLMGNLSELTFACSIRGVVMSVLHPRTA